MSRRVIRYSDNILYGGTIESRVTKGATSMGQFCLDRLKLLGDKVVLIDGVTGAEVTASELRKSAIDFAQNLRALGIKENETVGICCENRFEFVHTIFGTLLLNATIAPFNVTYTEHELNHAFNLAKPKILFGSNLTIKKLAKIAQNFGCIRNMVNFDETTSSRFIMPYSKFLKASKEKPTDEFKVKPTSLRDNVVVLLCSSGTTGLPKGVQLTQQNFLHTADVQFVSRGHLAGLPMLLVLPWFHVYGFVTIMLLCVIGTRTVFLPKFKDDLFLKCIQDYKIYGGFLVTPLMVFLAKSPLVDRYNLTSLKMIYCGAAPLKYETAQLVKKRLGVSVVRQGYGMTETTTSVMAQRDGNEKPGSCGTLHAEIYAKVVDPETGKVLGAHQNGELCFKGDLIMKGYANDKNSTAQSIDSDGWLHTGDIGYYDDDLEFFVVDRLKELIKYKGFQVPPAELEALLLTHPKIKDAGVVGVPDEACGELPMAFVVGQPNVVVMEKEVVDFIAERVSPAKRLHGGVQFVDEIPKTSSGKILRRVLREMVGRTNTNVKSKL